MRSCCSTADHEQLKSDAARWSALKLIGVQRFDDDEPALEMRNCPCGSTLCKEVLTECEQFVALRGVP